MRKLLPILSCLVLLISCDVYHVSDDPTLQLSFSHDTLYLDTIFTEQGSATYTLMVYNTHSRAMVIDRIWQEEGDFFRVNVDGEQDLDRLQSIQINGKDSMFIFVRVKIDSTHQDAPLFITDRLHFHLQNGKTQSIQLEAHAQEVVRIGHKGCGRTNMATYHFTATKPYLLFDTLVVHGDILMDAGTTIYMHNGACIYGLGDMTCNGRLDAPILIRGDRLDQLFDSVPYLYASGSWNGIYLQAERDNNYELHYVDILSGNVGLYCMGINNNNMPTLRMDGCRIHNHAMYGLVVLNTNAQVINSEISNCASYCVYCSGGTHDFIHSTIASYFGYTNIRIQSTAKEDAAAVFIDNLQKNEPQTITSFYNSIITGYLPNQLVVATPFDRYYPGSFIGNYLQTDTLVMPHAKNNAYRNASDTSSVFINTYYKYKEYHYYDFHLDSISPAIGIGDSLIAEPYPNDRDGNSRSYVSPDAGCYQL